MNWLVDTDILSERTKPRPDAKVLAWMEANADSIYTSSHVIGELQTGIALLSEGSKKRALQGLAEPSTWSRGWKGRPDSGISIPALRPCGDDGSGFQQEGLPHADARQFHRRHGAAARPDPRHAQRRGLHRPAWKVMNPAAGLP